MLAFMSNPRRYDVCHCPVNTSYYGLAHDCERQAMREAERILSETEPFLVWPEGQEASLVYMARNYGAAGGASLALADALARFLEEPGEEEVGS